MEDPLSLTISLEYAVAQVNSPTESTMTEESLQISSVASMLDEGDTMCRGQSLQSLVPPYSYVCLWRNCNCDVGPDVKELDAHVLDHLSRLEEVREYQCYWGPACEFTTEDRTDFAKHVMCHVFHTYLKRISVPVLDEIGKHCQNEERHPETTPALGGDFTCLVNGCGKQWISALDYYWHVETHVLRVCEIDPSKKRSQRVLCPWSGCNKRFSHVSRVLAHVKSHTQEKTFACPDCGLCFGAKAKFVDHLHRREDAADFECDVCLKRFPTERLIRDHQRKHVNRFRCPLCSVTTKYISDMSRHMRYRHSEQRAHKCAQCDASFKTNSDLRSHLDVHSKMAYACPVEGCDAVFKSAKTYQVHSLKVHQQMSGDMFKVYRCHLCAKRFTRGTNLTDHLTKRHRLSRELTRFRYTRTQDGFFELQTVRLETTSLSKFDGVLDKKGAEPKPSCSTDENFTPALTIDMVPQDGGQVLVPKIVESILPD
ncbi:unnamed protein product [Cyprideis torosa]|uniref:Uncharacterized protein n=1 Tax=Cyprideis torosa TaxID=163714 RepID=A0A7R8W7V8_9CRUS|nr:unnamed protein product [Cyprideis torosa]CAG0882821.1 unnamed protein product [Cyprideis torosa]